MAARPAARRSSDIAEQIRAEIDRGDWKPRQQLPPERQLAERFGVSRDTVRRALSQLTDELLITAHRGSGSFVRAEPGQQIGEVFQTARPLELMDVRFALEPHICRLAVLNAVPDHFDRMESLLAEMESKTEDAAGFADADTQFHSLLVETTGNPLLIWMAAQINSVRGHRQWTRMRQLTLEADIITQYNTQHRAIVNAIHDREPEEAAKQMRTHLETARLSLTRASAT